MGAERPVWEQDIVLERRLTGLEKDRDHIVSRIRNVEELQIQQAAKAAEQKQVLDRTVSASNWMLKDLVSVRETVAKMQAEQQRFVLGAALGLGGLLLQLASFGLQALRAKLGF